MQVDAQKFWTRLRLLLLCIAACLCASCAGATGGAEYFGRVTPPSGQVLRYYSGPEPESLDPQIGTGQPETRIYMALFDGLAEYDPKTMEPIPAIAESWETSADSTEMVFHLRHNARWSNGDPVTAQDFVYSWRRGLSPALASRNAYLAYYVKYAQGYNAGGVFVRDPQTGQFLLERDFPAPNATKTGTAATATAATPPAPANSPHTPAPTATTTPGEKTPTMETEKTTTEKATAAASTAATSTDAAPAPALPDTPFHQFIDAPARLVLPGTEKARAKALDARPALRAATEGKEFVPIKAEDIGVEAVDDFTLRVTLMQPAPFFTVLLPHPFLRAVPRKAIEQHKGDWTKPANIITCGAFKLDVWEPYNEIQVVRDPLYWDAARVRLERIVFYTSDEMTTMMNLYKSGDLDATSNHTVPASWVGMIQPLKDYMDAPELAIIYYLVNVTKPPLTDARVRRAFNMAIDKHALADYRHVKPLTAFSPEGIFPGYPRPVGDDFNPARAKQLLAEAGYRDAAGAFDASKFPSDKVEISYSTNESNRQVAEFIQAQWKQNLGLTIPLKSMEFKTFLAHRAALSYNGFAYAGYAGDYNDPYTFLNLLAAPGGENGTGWWDARYVSMLDEANHTTDHARRFDMLSKAEAYLLAAQPVIPLYVPSTKWMKKPYVKGMYANAGTLHAWKFVYIEPDRQKWTEK